METGEGQDPVTEGLMTEINPEWFDSDIMTRDDAIISECIGKNRNPGGGAITERQSNKILLCLRGYGMTSFALPTSFYRPQQGGMPKDPVTGEPLRLPITEDMQRDVIQGTKTYAKPPPRKDMLAPLKDSPAARPTPEQQPRPVPVPAAPVKTQEVQKPAPAPTAEAPENPPEETPPPEQKGPARPALYLAVPPAPAGEKKPESKPGQYWVTP